MTAHDDPTRRVPVASIEELVERRVAAEREACAALCDVRELQTVRYYLTRPCAEVRRGAVVAETWRDAAAAIRARGGR